MVASKNIGRLHKQIAIGALLHAMDPQQFKPKIPKTMKRLSIVDTPQEICTQYDVYFDGVKQRLCHTADVEKGIIIRFVHGMGRLPIRDRTGKYKTELLQGKVQIVLKGETPSAES